MSEAAGRGVTMRDGRSRVEVEAVSPEIDCGRFPIRRVVGDRVEVEVLAYGDGHDSIAIALLHRPVGAPDWSETAMALGENDRWRASFTVDAIGRWEYSATGWVDRFTTWSTAFAKRVEAGQDVAVDLLVGAELVEAAAARAGTGGAAAADGRRLAALASAIRGGGPAAAEAAASDELAALMRRYAERPFATRYERDLGVWVDRERARFGAWYELFPRSATTEPGRHGTFRDVIERLPEIAAMGFDVLYLPPVHPIGRAFRKGRNNSTTAAPGEPGSPWAIGGPEGGHTALHPELGTLDDFRALVAAAADHGLEIALDLAFQCSPDHPWATEHPEWFRRRPDGSIQYAENPPKKYQDIYPFDFETDAWRELWAALKGVVDHWIGEGVRIFRVDNPHTKPFAFWEWLIGETRREHPDVIFLAEAFTRPAVLYRLAKLGYSQSYNYFPWRNTKAELTEWFTELTTTEVAEYFGPNLWPNTPDILTTYLQVGGRPAFVTRIVLAATLGPSYGIYGPVYEQCVNVPLAPGKEEYLDSEKYEIRPWDPDRAGTLAALIGRLNAIRHEHEAFRSNAGLAFHEIGNDELIAYSKGDATTGRVLVIVNLDPHHRQGGWVELPLEALGLAPDQPYEVDDLLTGERYLWHGSRNYVELAPDESQAHVFAFGEAARSETDFDYYA